MAEHDPSSPDKTSERFRVRAENLAEPVKHENSSRDSEFPVRDESSEPRTRTRQDTERFLEACRLNLGPVGAYRVGSI